MWNLGEFSWKSTQRSVSQENAVKKSKNPSPFSRKTIGSSNSFILIANNFRFLRYRSEVWIQGNSALWPMGKIHPVKIAKFEFKVTVHCGLWAKYIQVWPLKLINNMESLLATWKADNQELLLTTWTTGTTSHRWLLLNTHATRVIQVSLLS